MTPDDTTSASSGPVVTGMVWTDASQEPAVLAGPAIGAALGAHAAGGGPELLVAFSSEVPEAAQRLLRALDPVGRLITRRPGASLRWTAGLLLADTRNWRLEGDPRSWFATCAPSVVRGRALVLANGNPSAHADLLERGEPAFAGIDIDAMWAASQTPAIRRCLKCVHLVTITGADYTRLPPAMRAELRLGARGGPALLLKDGARGVRIAVDAEERHLPAPELPGPAGTDVGAGDVLLGIMTTLLAEEPGAPSLDRLEAAYRRSLPVLARLLISKSFARFANELLEGTHGP